MRSFLIDLTITFLWTKSRFITSCMPLELCHLLVEKLFESWILQNFLRNSRLTQIGQPKLKCIKNSSSTSQSASTSRKKSLIGAIKSWYELWAMLNFPMITLRKKWAQSRKLLKMKLIWMLDLIPWSRSNSLTSESDFCFQTALFHVMLIEKL